MKLVNENLKQDTTNFYLKFIFYFFDLLKQLQQDLPNEIAKLKALLPNKYQQQFIQQLGGLLETDKLADGHLAGLAKSEEFAGLLYEYYNRMQDSVNCVAGVKQEAPAVVVGSQQVMGHSQTEEQTRDQGLGFKEIKARLTAEDYKNIFRNYVGAIHSQPKVISEKGKMMVSGSVQMDLTTGRWTRFSRRGEDGRFLSGDIFAFVGLATGKNAREQLELLAEVAAGRSFAAEAVVEAVAGDKRSEDWCAYGVVPEWAEQFIAQKHLSFLLKDKELAGVYAYRNVAGELIGYTVRPVDKQTGRKLGVLPVAYCHNGKYGQELKAGWKQKGFVDGGYKPIYGLEKLGQSRRPVLIVEGEKTADSAQQLLPEYVVISWLGGSTAALKVDWRYLQDREVSIWPDNDVSGLQAANIIARQLENIASCCLVVDPRTLGLPSKWDLADPVPAGVNIRAALISSKQPETIAQIDQQIAALDDHMPTAEQQIKLIGREVTTRLQVAGKLMPLYQARLEEELVVISKTGFAEDFLIAGNIARFCQAMNIAIGDGRGSAVSSLVAYGLGIHQVDPIEHNLLFERFLTENSSKKPDFDFDIAASKKVLVENYLLAKYGNAAKLSVITKEGEVKVHPSGIGLIPGKVKEQLALEELTRIKGQFWEDRQYLKVEHKAAEKLGVRKFDLLSSHIVEAVAKVEELIASNNQGKRIDWQQIDWHDQKTFALIEAGDTEKVNQLGTEFAGKICQQVRVGSFNDIVNLLALLRPSSKRYVSCFAAGGKSYSQFSDPKGVFKESKGVPLFQEQIMQAASSYLGLSKAETNDFRRELGKEQSSHPLTDKKELVKVAVNNGLSQQDSVSLYGLLKEASKYGFNKSHAVAYGQLTFKSAYLKAHYPELFNEVFRVKESEPEKIANETAEPLTAAKANKSGRMAGIKRREAGTLSECTV